MLVRIIVRKEIMYTKIIVLNSDFDYKAIMQHETFLSQKALNYQFKKKKWGNY
jgi:hypothetical protein